MHTKSSQAFDDLRDACTRSARHVKASQYGLRFLICVRPGRTDHMDDAGVGTTGDHAEPFSCR